MISFSGSRANQSRKRNFAPYRGISLPLRISPGKKNRVYMDQDCLVVETVDSGKWWGNKDRVRILLREWYREQARVRICSRVDHYSRLMQVEWNKVRIKDVSSIWGSSSKRRNLNFNYRLIMFDDSLLDYVVVHELAHQIRHDHSKEFWAIVEKYIPDWKKRRKRLREIPPELFHMLSVQKPKKRMN